MTIKLVNRTFEGELLLEGQLDPSSAPEVAEIFAQVSQRFDRIVLNLAGLSYISSAGLRVFRDLNMTMRRKGGELLLKNVDKRVMEVFEMTGFAGLVKIRN